MIRCVDKAGSIRICTSSVEKSSRKIPNKGALVFVMPHFITAFHSAAYCKTNMHIKIYMLHNNLECRVQPLCIGARAVHFEISIELNNELQPIKCTAVQYNCKIYCKLL